MLFLVDAYNLLFRTLKKSGSLEKNRQKVIEELNEAAFHAHMQITLVFDGAEDHLPYASRGHFDAVELVYTPKSMTADEYISDRVIHAKSPSQITVVTSDRELSTRCRSHRAKTMSIDEFITFVIKKKTKRKKAARTTERVFRDSSSEFTRLLMIFEKKTLEQLNDEMEDF